MITAAESAKLAKMELANRLFFRLYQCANMLHKTGTRAIDAEGLTTQQWAVLGALSRPQAEAGMSIGDLARYLMLSRQNLSGVLSRMERDGHVKYAPHGRDRRSRLVTMTKSGRHVWLVKALPKIHAYYEQALADLSINDITHTLHYLLKMLENMRRIDAAQGRTTKPASERERRPSASAHALKEARRDGLLPRNPGREAASGRVRRARSANAAPVTAAAASGSRARRPAPSSGRRTADRPRR
jgi:DNA-binding MarR family transcriptional regulator